MKNIEHTQKLSVLHCIYQLIGSAEGAIDEERDYEAIKLGLDVLELPMIYSWDAALKLNPHDCFFHISTLDDSNKLIFKELLIKICEMEGNKNLRLVCANHIFQLCQIQIN